ncbi:sulfonate ABC transporter substrate-binding protein [Pseudanabaena sp. UWO310]|uniref:sulfonate ABC transporter substrate-binding protein n=1 Tax=Pseudanabaena sp. UWO310 TaxID=2480795 RepID=UPI0011599D9F|nr:sulfonate ABC transporter substrate-binding protein [Pseudanabaena sp. UWO310]TYQ31315.1 sulfonate ABC transporter substrate-binding protein [Pseudanabaena sp. UWO310]
MVTLVKQIQQSQRNSIFKQITLLVIPSVIALSTALTSCSNSSNQGAISPPSTSKNEAKPVVIKTKVVRLGYQTAGDIVKVKGVLEKRLEPLGVKVEWSQFAAGPQLMEALNVGKIDLGSVGETPPIFAQAAGSSLVYVSGRRPSEGKGSAIIVQKDSPIKSVADLKGQKVVFQKGSASHYLLIKALDEVGLKYSDIQAVTLPPVDAREAFIQGRIDAWVTWDPYLAFVQSKAEARVLRDANKIATQGGFYIASRSFATENPEALRIILEEIDKNGEWAEANRPEVVKLVAPILKIDPQIYEIVSSRASYRLRAITPQVLEEQQNIADLFTQEKVIPKKIDIKDAALTTEQYAAIIPESLKIVANK